MENDLSQEDKMLIKEIYEDLTKIRDDVRSFDGIEQLLHRAISIAEKYGPEHQLYISLCQTRDTQLNFVKQLAKRDRELISAVFELKLFFRGDLLGWFKI